MKVLHHRFEMQLFKGEKKGEAGSEAAPVAAVQKARKVQKKVVKGVHGTRVKKVGEQ